jgi:crotonobetainyl-CoA:carnitine CoA-transferase CaiB-like acyl-CoA transferase
LISGRVATRHGNNNAASSPSGTFHTGDGLLNIAANTQRQFESICEAVGRSDLVADERFLTRELRKRHRNLLTVELEQALSAHSALEWEERLIGVNVPVGQVLSLSAAIDQEQLKVRSLVHDVEVNLENHQRIPVLGSAIHVDGAALEPSSPPPRLGEHTHEILLNLGFDADEIEALRSAHAV